METFGFLVHPMNIEDVARKYRIARKVSPKVVASVLRRRRPFVVSEITGVRSATGVEAAGWFVAVPLLPWQMLELEEDYVVEKILKATEVARKEGARIVGLGAFTALVGGGGRAVARQAKIPITTGNTYTVGTAIEGAKKAAGLMGIVLERACVAIVGATGSIGSACAEVLAPVVGRLVLVGRDSGRLSAVAERISPNGQDVSISTSTSAITAADVIISATGAVDAILRPGDIRSGAVVCDVARPRDVSEQVTRSRDDVLVIDGGVVKVPGPVEFNFDFGLPKRMALACMAETMILALEGRYESYTIGKEISADKVREMDALASKHGFSLAALRGFDRAIPAEAVERIRARVKKN